VFGDRGTDGTPPPRGHGAPTVVVWTIAVHCLVTAMDDLSKSGPSQGMCVRTVPGKAWECFWTLSLASGQITVEGPFYDIGDSVLAITGGTGAFGNAQGDMLLSPIGTEGKAFRFTYRLQ